MTIHFFTKGDIKTASSRPRAFFVAEELNRLGINATVHWPPVELISQTKWPGKLKLIIAAAKNLLNVKKGDIAFFQRTIYNKYFFCLIILHKLIFRRKMIFDFDDAIYLHSLFKTKLLVKMADAVIAGNSVLAGWAGRYNKNVYIIPTSIKFESFSGSGKKDYAVKDKFVIGWVGNALAHLKNLKLLVPVFENLLRDGLRFKFILVGAKGNQEVYDLFRNIEGLDVEFIDSQDPASVPGTIQKFDVGLMPLVDTEWSRGKCALKAIEYMGCGVPAVCSPVGANNDVISNGENGFLAGSTEEWITKIEKLYSNPKLVLELGRKAKETILKNYSFEINIPKITDIIKKL